MKNICIKDKTFKPFIFQEDIGLKIAEIASTLNRDYQEKVPLILVVLNGAFRFGSDLIRHLDIPLEIAFVRLTSYQGTQQGALTEVLPADVSFQNREVLIVEDIVDTGQTVAYLLAQVQAQQPASIALATLLLKPRRLGVTLPLRYVGFEISDEFVVGFGLDYDNLGRELNDLYQLDF